jgi:hypothetical protein
MPVPMHEPVDGTNRAQSSQVCAAYPPAGYMLPEHPGDRNKHGVLLAVAERLGLVLTAELQGRPDGPVTVRGLRCIFDVVKEHPRSSPGPESGTACAVHSTPSLLRRKSGVGHHAPNPSLHSSISLLGNAADADRALPQVPVVAEGRGAALNHPTPEHLAESTEECAWPAPRLRKYSGAADHSTPTCEAHGAVRLGELKQQESPNVESLARVAREGRRQAIAEHTGCEADVQSMSKPRGSVPMIAKGNMEGRGAVLKCSVCWQAAARHMAAMGRAELMSKSALKRQRRAAAKARKASGCVVTGGGLNRQAGVAEVATELADAHVLPVLREAVIQQDVGMSGATMTVYSERGHLLVAIDIRKVLEGLSGHQEMASDEHGTTVDRSVRFQNALPSGASDAPGGRARTRCTDDVRSAMCTEASNAEGPLDVKGHERTVSAGCGFHEGDAECKKPGEADCICAACSEAGMEWCVQKPSKGSVEDTQVHSVQTEVCNSSAGSHYSNGSWREGGSDVSSEAPASERTGSGISNGTIGNYSSSSGACMHCEEAPERRADLDNWWLQAPPGGRWPFRMMMEPSSFRKDEYELWQRYQQEVHKDPPFKTSRSSYQRFLVDHPFPMHKQAVPMAVEEAMVADGEAPRCGYGAFHVQFWIGDHLVAVSVIDVLPRCAPDPIFSCAWFGLVTGGHLWSLVVTGGHWWSLSAVQYDQ